MREKCGNIHIIIYKTESQWKIAIWCRELNPVLCDNLEGWDEKEVGGRCNMLVRNQYNIVKQFSSSFKKIFKNM